MTKISNGNMRALMGVALMGSFCVGINNLHAAEKKTTTPSNTFNCAADPSWFSAPSMPTEVKQSAGPGDSTFCDFYQFSWQAFAYLMAPSANNPKVLNFE